MKKITFGLGATALLFGACAEGPQSTTDDFGYEGTGIQVSIAPLVLDSLTDACYSFAITNERNQLVVGRGPGAASVHGILVSGTAENTICASQFGNGDGGDISYVAPCDADLPVHTVRLWVDALCTDGVPNPLGVANWENEEGDGICFEMQDYVNPCGSFGCELTVECRENADTPVTFNFTIMGQADQGFFDVAVNFDDVFCSAKMDTCADPDGDGDLRPESIKLVFDPATGERMDTLVLAVACTRGPDFPDAPDSATATHLTFGILNVTCGGVGENIPLNTVVQEGNQIPIGGLNWAAYFGTEALPGANKVYTNLAFGIPAGAACDVDWEVVPSSGEFAVPGGSNTYNSYGYVDFTARGIGEGSKGCTQLPMDGLPGTSDFNGTGEVPDGVGVTTAYKDPNDSDFSGNAQLGQGDDRLTLWLPLP